MITGVTSFIAQASSQCTSSAQKQRPNLFNEIDSNQDGTIDKAELTSFIQSQANQKSNSVNIDQLFSKLDTDGNGSISKSESDAFQSRMAANRPDMFSRMDTNQDGSIDKTEFTAFMKNRPAHHGHSGAQAASDADGDSDSDQSSDIDSLFAAMDTNGDGVISKAESDAYREKMHAQNGTGQAGDPAASSQVMQNSNLSASGSAAAVSNPAASEINTLIQQYMQNYTSQLTSVNLLA